MKDREHLALERLIRFDAVDDAREQASALRAIRTVLNWPAERIETHTRSIEKEQT